LAVEQQIAGLQKVAVLRELLDGIAAIEQNTFIAVDVGYFGLAAGGGREAGVVRKHPALAIELRDVDDVWADRSWVDRHVPIVVPDRQRAGLILGAGLGVHSRALKLAASGARNVMVRDSGRFVRIPFICA